jgi:hypothetical protein
LSGAKSSIGLVAGVLLALGNPVFAGRNYHFDGEISRDVLESYLSRSITMTEIYRSPGNLNDDIRMLKNIGAKFAGRTIYLWGSEARINDPKFLQQGRDMARRIHQNDPDVVLQAAVFEIVTDAVNQVPVPGWVFKEFGQPAEARNFDYSKMLFPDGTMVNHWRQGSSVPDIRQMETRMWFFFLAGSYMDIGIEAIHFGQLDLVGRKDAGYVNWVDLFRHVRGYSAKKARRIISAALVLREKHRRLRARRSLFGATTRSLGLRTSLRAIATNGCATPGNG